MTTLTIKTPSDFAPFTEQILGFVPTESLVTVALGGGPTARVDLGTGAVAALAPVAEHCTRVALVLYSTEDVLLDYEAEFTSTYPELEVVAAVRVDGDTVWHLGKPYTRAEPTGPRVIYTSREALAEHIKATVPTTGEAITLALSSYQAGDGASAWLYLERYEALGGDTTTPAFAGLSMVLRDGIDPKTFNDITDTTEEKA